MLVWGSPPTFGIGPRNPIEGVLWTAMVRRMLPALSFYEAVIPQIISLGKAREVEQIREAIIFLGPPLLYVGSVSWDSCV